MSARLQQEVWALQRCSGCGACVAACSKGVLYWDEEEHPLLEEREKALGLSHLRMRTCEVCERFCELSCPRLVDWLPMEPHTTLSARSVGVIQSGDPSDVIQALLVAGRSADLIDGVVMVDMDPWTLEPAARVVTTVGEIINCAGIQYLWTPVLSTVNEAIFHLGLSRLAIVGTPCVAEGARRLVNSQNERLWPYKRAIRLIIAPFCTGTYMPGMVTELIERGLGIPRCQIRSLAISPAEATLTLSLWTGIECTIPLTEVERFTRRGCSSCNDYLGESADIAVGTVGAQPGYATVITRTSSGEIFVHNAIQFDLLETIAQVDEAALNTAKMEKDRRARAQAFDKLLILTLDALHNPGKRAQAKEQFASLYGTTHKVAPKEEGCHATCSGC